MGAGLQRAKAVAEATRLNGDDTHQVRIFFNAIKAYGGAASPQECPTATRAQDRVRRIAKKRGWVTFEGGYWRMTDAGAAARRNL